MNAFSGTVTGKERCSLVSMSHINLIKCYSHLLLESFKIHEDIHFDFDLCSSWETDLCVSKVEDFSNYTLFLSHLLYSHERTLASEVKSA